MTFEPCFSPSPPPSPRARSSIPLSLGRSGGGGGGDDDDDDAYQKGNGVAASRRSPRKIVSAKLGERRLLYCFRNSASFIFLSFFLLLLLLFLLFLLLFARFRLHWKRTINQSPAKLDWTGLLDSAKKAGFCFFFLFFRTIAPQLR